MAESKGDAFKRLAERRTNAILDRIRVLGNLSNPYAYEYNEDDVRAIFSAIDQELRATRAKFQANRRREFRLRADDAARPDSGVSPWEGALAMTRQEETARADR